MLGLAAVLNPGGLADKAAARGRQRHESGRQLHGWVVSDRRDVYKACALFIPVGAVFVIVALA